MALAFRPLHGDFGAEVVDLPPALALDDATFAAIEDAWRRFEHPAVPGLA